MSTILHKFFQKSLFLSLILFSCMALQAEKPNAEGALKTAQDFFKSDTRQLVPAKTIQPIALIQRYKSPESKHASVFVFQNQTNGFVIVAQNNGESAVVGYSPNGVFDATTLPQQLKALLSLYEDSIGMNAAVTAKIKMATPVMTPLLDEKGISLNQFGHETVGNCPTGCVATAFTQVMCYYQYPSKGKGSHCYTHTTYGQLCADFENTTYNWNNPTSEDYQLLSYHVGIAMDMNYCGAKLGSFISGSAPYKWGYEKAMSTYFRYFLRNGSTESYFIKNEIDNRRPIYVELPGDPGHAVVLDGYDTDGFFHINFGWGGQYNGYYVLNSNSTFNVGYKFGTNISAAYFISPTAIKTNVQDSLALVAIHNGLGGTTGWDLTRPVNSWSGVLVVNERVTELSLNNGNYLIYKGIIAPEIGQLTAMKRLNLLGQLDGSLPETITNLTSLTNLSIYGGAGTIKITLPANIGNLVNLETLIIPMKCEGALPTSIGNLTKLKILDLNSGNLSGNIPAEIGNLTNLTTLNLWKNKITGSIPGSIVNLIKLESVILSENQLSGALPNNIGNLTELTTFTLNDNQLSGTLPQSIGNCSKLIILSLYNNQFSGEIPASLGNLLSIKSLNFSNNKFSSLPNEMGNWSNLEELNINTNQIVSIPESVNNLTKLKSLDAGNNQIAELPDNFGFLPSLNDLNLSFNNITVFPDALCQLTKLQSITFRKNKLEKFPSSIKLLPTTLTYLALDDNELRSPIPKELLEKGLTLLLSNNHFTFEDIPASSKFKNGVGNQKPVNLTKKIFKAAIGDTVKIDIRQIAPFSLTTNQYNWVSVNRNKVVSSTPNPILTVIIDEKTINNKYYCSVSNPSSPMYSYTDFGYTYTFPCMSSVNTDTLSFQLATEEELISEKYDGKFVVSAKNVLAKTVEDKIVTLVPPLKVRGTVQWQASSDGKTWHDLSDIMSQNDLKSNFVSVKSNELILSPKTPAFYRCSVTDLNCEPLYSDTIKVNPYGKVMYDAIVNSATQTKTIKVDSIEVTLPKGIYDKDFRLTIVKLDDQPSALSDVKLGTAYDVTVSFADTFGTRLLIKLKNIDKKTFDKRYIHNYKAVYLDKNTHQWVTYDNSYISLQDTTMVFETNHLTVVNTGYWNKWNGYDKVYERNNIHVYYKSDEEAFMRTTYGKKQTTQPWHVADVPVMVQDVTEYLVQIRKKFQSSGVPIPDVFEVYIKQMDDADGVVGVSGMINDYLTIHTFTENPINLRGVLAHEYMHYTQAKYMSPDPGNIFWMEANAHLTDRLVWDEAVIPICESDNYLLNGRKAENSIYNFLSNSWDYWDRGFWSQNLFGELNYCYLAGTFIHYMRSYSLSEKKLNPIALLKETTQWSGDTWRTYLSNYVAFSMNSTLGDEYDNFVKYLLSGENKNLTILNTEENPYSYLIKNCGSENNGTFVKRLVYNFAKDENEQQKDNVEMKIPYLASKVLLLYNQTADRAMVVNYKRLHTFNRDNKIYYGKYDFKTKKTTYVDISDSTKYNIFIEARSEKSVKENQNICFLLLVNKKHQTNSLADFNASFELTATPVFDIEYLYSAWIAGADGNSLFVHTNSQGNKDAFNLSGVHLTINSANVVSHIVNNYSTNRTIINDSTYVVDIAFGDETRSEYNDIGSLPGIQISDKQIRIEYNYIAATMKLRSVAKFTNKYETIYDEKPKIVLGSVWYDDTKLDLKNLNTMTISSGGDNTLLRTNNSTETQSVVEKMSDSHREVRYDNVTGLVSMDETTTYVSTDYSGGDVVLKVLLKMK